MLGSIQYGLGVVPKRKVIVTRVATHPSKNIHSIVTRKIAIVLSAHKKIFPQYGMREANVTPDAKQATIEVAKIHVYVFIAFGNDKLRDSAIEVFTQPAPRLGLLLYRGSIISCPVAVHGRGIR